jgi:hypothetical protein
MSAHIWMTGRFSCRIWKRENMRSFISRPTCSGSRRRSNRSGMCEVAGCGQIDVVLAVTNADDLDRSAAEYPKRLHRAKGFCSRGIEDKESVSWMKAWYRSRYYRAGRLSRTSLTTLGLRPCTPAQASGHCWVSSCCVEPAPAPGCQPGRRPADLRCASSNTASVGTAIHRALPNVGLSGELPFVALRRQGVLPASPRATRPARSHLAGRVNSHSGACPRREMPD